MESSHETPQNVPGRERVLSNHRASTNIKAYDGNPIFHSGKGPQFYSDSLPLKQGITAPMQYASRGVEENQPNRRSRFFWLTTLLVSVLFVLVTPRLGSLTLPSGVFLVNNLVPNVARFDATSPGVLSADKDAPKVVERLPTLARTDQVTFDNYSLFLRGQRIFLQCV